MLRLSGVIHVVGGPDVLHCRVLAALRKTDIPKFQIFVQGFGTGPKCIMVDGRTTFRDQCPLGTSLEDAGVRSHDWLQVCKRDRGGGKPPRVEGDAIAALTTMLHNQGADKTEADNFARAVMPKVGASGQQRRPTLTRLSKACGVSLLQPQSNCRTHDDQCIQFYIGCIACNCSR